MGATRSGTQDAAEAQKNKNWDPNSPLYGKTPSRTPASVAAPASTTVAPAVAAASAALPAASKPAGRVAADPLGDLAASRAAASGGVDPFDYFVQAGAFRTQQDADAQRAKLAMMGWEARVSEREQNGRTVYRVRVGPFGKRDDAQQIKEKLDGAAVDSALVRAPR